MRPPPPVMHLAQTPLGVAWAPLWLLRRRRPPPAGPRPAGVPLRTRAWGSWRCGVSGRVGGGGSEARKGVCAGRGHPDVCHLGQCAASRSGAATQECRGLLLLSRAQDASEREEPHSRWAAAGGAAAGRAAVGRWTGRRATTTPVSLCLLQGNARGACGGGGGGHACTPAPAAAPSGACPRPARCACPRMRHQPPPRRLPLPRSALPPPPRTPRTPLPPSSVRHQAAMADTAAGVARRADAVAGGRPLSFEERAPPRDALAGARRPPNWAGGGGRAAGARGMWARRDGTPAPSCARGTAGGGLHPHACVHVNPHPNTHRWRRRRWGRRRHRRARRRQHPYHLQRRLCPR